MEKEIAAKKADSFVEDTDAFLAENGLAGDDADENEGAGENDAADENEDSLGYGNDTFDDSTASENQPEPESPSSLGLTGKIGGDGDSPVKVQAVQPTAGKIGEQSPTKGKIGGGGWGKIAAKTKSPSKRSTPTQINGLAIELALLTEVPFLKTQSALSADEKMKFLQDLAAELKKTTYEKGDVIFEEGQPSSEMYMIVAGTVELRMNHPDIEEKKKIANSKTSVVTGDDMSGAEVAGTDTPAKETPTKMTTLDVLLPGASFGEYGMLTTGNNETLHSMSAVAHSECELYQLTKQKLHQIATSNPGWARQLLEWQRTTRWLGALIREMPAFRGCERGTLLQILAKAQPRKFAKNDMVFEQGETAQKMYFIKSGLLEVCVRKPGRLMYTILTTLGAGEYFGEIGCLTGSTRTAAIRSRSATSMLYELDRNDVLIALKQHPEMMQKIVNLASEKLRKDRETLIFTQDWRDTKVQRKLEQEREKKKQRLSHKWEKEPSGHKKVDNMNANKDMILKLLQNKRASRRTESHEDNAIYAARRLNSVQRQLGAAEALDSLKKEEKAHKKSKTLKQKKRRKQRAKQLNQGGSEYDDRQLSHLDPAGRVSPSHGRSNGSNSEASSGDLLTNMMKNDEEVDAALANAILDSPALGWRRVRHVVKPGMRGMSAAPAGPTSMAKSSSLGDVTAVVTDKKKSSPFSAFGGGGGALGALFSQTVTAAKKKDEEDKKKNHLKRLATPKVRIVEGGVGPVEISRGDRIGTEKRHEGELLRERASEARRQLQKSASAPAGVGTAAAAAVVSGSGSGSGGAAKAAVAAALANRESTFSGEDDRKECSFKWERSYAADKAMRHHKCNYEFLDKLDGKTAEGQMTFVQRQEMDQVNKVGKWKEARQENERIVAQCADSAAGGKTWGQIGQTFLRRNEGEAGLKKRHLAALARHRDRQQRGLIPLEEPPPRKPVWAPESAEHRQLRESQQHVLAGQHGDIYSGSHNGTGDHSGEGRLHGKSTGGGGGGGDADAALFKRVVYGGLAWAVTEHPDGSNTVTPLDQPESRSQAIVEHMGDGHGREMFGKAQSSFFTRMEHDTVRRREEEEKIKVYEDTVKARLLAKATHTHSFNAEHDQRDAHRPLTRRLNLLLSLFERILNKDDERERQKRIAIAAAQHAHRPEIDIDDDVGGVGVDADADVGVDAGVGAGGGAHSQSFLNQQRKLSQDRLRRAVFSVNGKIPDKRLHLTQADVETLLWDADVAGDGEITKGAFNSAVVKHYGGHTGDLSAKGSRYDQKRAKDIVRKELTYTLNVIRLGVGPARIATSSAGGMIPQTLAADTTVGEVRAMLLTGQHGMLPETDEDLVLCSDTHAGSKLADTMPLSDARIAKPHNVVTLYII